MLPSPRGRGGETNEVSAPFFSQHVRNSYYMHTTYQYTNSLKIVLVDLS